MQLSFTRASGGLFIIAALTFWLGWALMPDAGSNDACCHDHHAGCDHAARNQQRPDDAFVQPGDV